MSQQDNSEFDGALVVKPRRARQMLSCSAPHLYGLINAGLLDSYKDGASRKITVESIRRYIAQRLAAKPVKSRAPRSPGRPRRAAVSAKIAESASPDRRRRPPAPSASP